MLEQPYKKEMIKLFQKYSILILWVVLSIQVSAQEEPWYLDYRISYYPKITSIKVKIEDNISLSETGEFNETLNRLAEIAFGKRKKIQRMPGMNMKSGIAPPVLKLAERWIKIEIKNDGDISNIEIYEGFTISEDDQSKLFANLLKTAKINPAMANDKKVNCRLFYLLIEDEE